MDAILTAGGTPLPGEPLYDFTNGQPKALLDVCGKTMIQWVIDALLASSTVDRILVVGLPSNYRPHAFGKQVEYLADQGGLLQNLRTGAKRIAELNPSADLVLSVASDIPGLTPGIVNWAVETCSATDYDFFYPVITREVMEYEYPGARRTYIKLKGGEFCGGDISVFRVSAVTGNEALWERLIASRKSPLKQASLLGYDLLFLTMLHLISLETIARKVSKRLNIKSRAILCPYAAAGMDVDKPHQLEIMRSVLVPHPEHAVQ